METSYITGKKAHDRKKIATETPEEMEVRLQWMRDRVIAEILEEKKARLQ